MDTIWVQVFTIVAVLLGAAASFLSTRYLERERFRRERQSRWDDRKIEACAAVADAVKEFIQTATRGAAGRGFGTGSPLPQLEGLEQLAQAETRMSIRWESVQLLGDPATVNAAGEWRRAAWHL